MRCRLARIIEYAPTAKSLAVVLLFYSFANAQPVFTWTQRIPSASPSPRANAAMAYDASHAEVVLFGGGANGNNNSETWVWNGNNWTQKFPLAKPSARNGHRMVFDSARNEIVLFGGVDSSAARLNDTWVWDGSNWIKKSPLTSPNARDQHAMAFDSARSQVVLFGGSPGGNETWTWDGANWSQRSPANSPSGRDGHAMAYDSARARVVLFGGGGELSDTWEWDGNNWLQRLPLSVPPGRAHHAAAYDSTAGRTLVFGGLASDSSLNDTWEWDGISWTQRTPNTSPDTRDFFTMAYDQSRNRTLVFGGRYRRNGVEGFLNDTWEWGEPRTDVTVQSNVTGRTILVDGVEYTSPQTFNWIAGSIHSIGTSSPQGTGGTRYQFNGWSDGGAIQHTIAVPITATTFTANFTTFYQLSIGASLGIGGQVAVLPSSGDGFYQANSQAQLTAIPQSGFQFQGWSGDLAGMLNPQTVAMNAPKTITANFVAIPCTFSLSSGTASVGSASAAGTVSVTASHGGCGWTVSNPANWVTVTAGASGTGNGSVSFSVQANTTLSARSAVLTIAGQPFTIQQEPATCGFSLDFGANSTSVAASGGTINIPIVVSPASCMWTASSADSWATITSGTSGIGSGTVAVQVQPNVGTTARSTTLTIAAITFTINQSGATSTNPVGNLRFVPLTPCRLMETRAEYNFEGRTGTFGPPLMSAGQTRTLTLANSNVCQIPATAKAYVLNVTLIPRGGVDFATLWPGGETRPNFWSIRSPDGQIVANQAIVKSGNGAIQVYVSHDADMLIDISGYFADPAPAGGTNLVYYPLTPCRVIETRIEYRSPAGPFGPPTMAKGEKRTFRFPNTPYCTVPPGATAYSATLTVVPPAPLPFMTLWPSGGAQPNVSSVNSFAGRILANNVIVPASQDGSIDVYAFDRTDFIVDINGYFAPDNGTGLYYFPVTQCRANDSAVTGGIYQDNTTRTINVPTAGNCAGIPGTAKGYVVNLTAIPNGNPMPFITVFPTGQPQPNASVLNAFQGQTVTNSTIVPAGTNGAIDVYAFRRTHVVVEISGYFGR